MVLLTRRIPSCVRRNSTHGIPSIPTQVHASDSWPAWLTAATKSGHFETSQAFVLGKFWRSPKICWHHPCHHEYVLALFWSLCHLLFWEEFVYHSVWHYMINVSSSNIFPCLSWIRPNTEKCIVNYVLLWMLSLTSRITMTEWNQDINQIAT